MANRSRVSRAHNTSRASLITRVAVDMKYHIYIHINIHIFFVDIHGYIYIHRCLSCVNVYPLNNYKAQLVSTVY